MTCFYMILWIHPLLFFQTAFSTPRRLLRRLPFYTCRRSGACRQRSRILPRVLTCLRICFSVSILALVSWSIRERNISWAGATVYLLNANSHTRTARTQSFGHCHGFIFRCNDAGHLSEIPRTRRTPGIPSGEHYRVYRTA